jgi:hypothetical protein
MNEKNYTKIGSYTPAADSDDEPVIEREYFQQGYIFKDEEAFYEHTDKVCYVPELSDSVYTRNDFLDLCGGNEDFAVECFDIVDWQHPESWIDEQYVNGEWDDCPKCEYLYSLYDVKHGKIEPVCKKCGARLDEGSVDNELSE